MEDIPPPADDGLLHPPRPIHFRMPRQVMQDDDDDDGGGVLDGWRAGRLNMADDIADANARLAPNAPAIRRFNREMLRHRAGMYWDRANPYLRGLTSVLAPQLNAVWGIGRLPLPTYAKVGLGAAALGLGAYRMYKRYHSNNMIQYFRQIIYSSISP